MYRAYGGVGLLGVLMNSGFVFLISPLVLQGDPPQGVSGETSPARIYIKLEAEDFLFENLDIWQPGVGLKPKWNRGGASSWATVAAPAEKGPGKITQKRVIPRAGEYTLWARYEDWAGHQELFEVIFEDGKADPPVVSFGKEDLAPDDGEWHWSYVWASSKVRLQKGPLRVALAVRGPARVRRGIDALILTDDPEFRPRNRGFPPHAYSLYLLEWAKTGEPLKPLLDQVPAHDASKGAPKGWELPKIAGRDFWYTGANSLASPMRKPVHISNFEGADRHLQAYLDRHAKDRVPPIFGLPCTAIQLSIGGAGGLVGKGSGIRDYIRKEKIPFVIVGNYGKAGGKDLYRRLEETFGELWLGIISGEGTYGTGFHVDPKAPPGGDARKDRCYQHILEAGTSALRAHMKGDWGNDLANPWERFVLCESVGTIPRVHLMAEAGCRLLGAESAAAMPYVAQQIAFVRGAARQYRRAWLWYYGASFGDAIRSFVKEPYFLEIQGRKVDNRNETVGPSLAHIRRVLLSTYLQGVTVFHPEQGYNLFGADGELNPMGWPYDEALRLASRHPDRGVTLAPVALLLDKAHGWEKYQYQGMHIWERGELERGDRMVDGFFNVAYFPFPKNEGEPVTDLNVPFPNGCFGDIFDVIVTSPTRRDAVDDYRVVFCLGKTRLDGDWTRRLKRFVAEGGTLVVNSEQLSPDFDEAFLGARLTGRWQEGEAVTCKRDATVLQGTPFRYRVVEPQGAEVVAVVEDKSPAALVRRVGKGRVVLTTPSYLLGEDDQPVPYLPHLLLELTSGLLPVRVRGNCEYFVNRHPKGYVIYLSNNEGLDKLSHSPARLDARKSSRVRIDIEETPRETVEWLGEEPRRWSLENEWMPEWTRTLRIGWTKEGKHNWTELTLSAAEVRVIFIRTRA
ncbi:MAG: hypothetical protein HY721_17960 [Planctomycetes bacterium]|nr:hypothetical protein [Planctomycetota bacterium]